MGATKPISDLEDHLGYWLRAVSNAVSQSFARKLEAEGVTVSEWVVLRMLHDSESMAPSLLAERMGMTKGAITKLADRLVEKDLIKRTSNTEDKRGQMLILARPGRTLLPRLAELADRNDAEYFGMLSAGERRTVAQLLRKIASDKALTNVPTD